MNQMTMRILPGKRVIAALFGLSFFATALPAQALEARIGGFTGFFTEANLSKNTTAFTIDETKIIPMVSFSENMELLSEFVYAFDRTGGPGGKPAPSSGKGADVPLKMERVFFSYYNLAPGMNMQVGQMRIPFGFWDDLTAQRKSARIKNTDTISGFKLRKRDVGLQLYGDVLPDSLLTYKLGVFNGNGENKYGDDDQTKDLVGHVGTKLGPLDLGVSTYYGSPFSSIQNYSVGMDYQLQVTNELFLSGEAAYKYNDNIQGKNYKSGHAVGGYLQANYNLYNVLPGMRLFAMYDAYQETPGTTTAALLSKYIGGFRYKMGSGVTGVMNYVYDTDKAESSIIGKIELVY